MVGGGEERWDQPLGKGRVWNQRVMIDRIRERGCRMSGWRSGTWLRLGESGEWPASILWPFLPPGKKQRGRCPGSKGDDQWGRSP